MTPRTQKRLLRACTMLVALASVYVVYLATQVGQSAGPRSVPAPGEARPDDSTATTARLTPRFEASLWERALRRPLYDPPPPPPPKVVKRTLPPLRSKLMGTIIEPGACKAMIKGASGTVQMLSEGDKLSPPDGDAVVVGIDSDSVRIARGDDISVLRVESPY